MPRLHRSALVERPAEHLFDVIEQAERYAEFLPWCAGATLHERSESTVAADLHVNWHGLRFTLGTRNAKQRPTLMTLALVRGPFRRFDGRWKLQPLTAQACKVAFELDYEFDAALAGRLAGPLFARMTETLVEGFVQRALVLPLAVPPGPIQHLVAATGAPSADDRLSAPAAAPPAAASASAPDAPG
jgi:ribosome-associated toxin RatA of RatAB toxin-antitoxin module